MLPYEYRATKTINPWKMRNAVNTVYSGGVNIFEPDSETIDLRDIANSLERIVRYNGQIERNYTVAEHCVEFAKSFDTDEDQLHALLHDAAEAYVGDFVSPIKKHIFLRNGESLEHVNVTEDRILDAIYWKCGISPESRPSLAEAEQRWKDREFELMRVPSNYKPGDYLDQLISKLRPNFRVSASLL